MLQSSAESTLTKRIPREGAGSSRDALLANNSANPDIVLNETANHAKKIGNNIVPIKKIILKMTKETNSVRRLFILKNIVVLSFLKTICEFHTQKFLSSL